LTFSDRLTFGIRPDSIFTKHSFMCAQTILKGNGENTITAWAILTDLLRRTYSSDNGTASSKNLGSVREYVGYRMGLSRQKVNYIPDSSYKSDLHALQLFGKSITHSCCISTTMREKYKQSIKHTQMPSRQREQRGPISIHQ